MRPRILCVDDEPRVLSGLRQVLFRSFDITAAAGGEAALALIDRGEQFEVVVSDLRMPQMNGATFLAEMRKRRPDITRLLLTGHADIEAAVAAVNTGQIFRFLSKPCPPDELAAALNDAVAQHRLMHSEKVLLEQTLVGSIRALSEVLALVHPEVFGAAMRQHARVRAVAERLRVPEPWQVEVASMLAAVGYVILPPDVAQKVRLGAALAPAEQDMAAQVPGVAERVLSHIPRLENVRSLLQWQDELRAGSSASEPAPLGARVLHAVIQLGIAEQRTGDVAAAVRELRSAGHPSDLLDALAAVCQPKAPEIRALSLSQIESGMTLAADVLTETGLLLMAHGQLVTEPLLQRMRNFDVRLGVVQPILCEMPQSETTTGLPLAI